VPFTSMGRKPQRWQINPTLVDPRWRWAWRGLIAAFPFWEPAGSVYSFGRGQLSGYLDRAGVSHAIGRYGHVIRGDGTRGHVHVNYTDWADLSGHDEVSVIVAITPRDVAGGTQTLFRHADATDQFILRVNTTETYRLYIETSAGSTEIKAPDYSAVNDVRQLVAGVYNGSTMKIYVDGIDLVSTALTGNLVSDTSDFFIAGRDADRFFEGDVHAAYLYNRALSVTELLQLTEDPFGPFRGLVRVRSKSTVVVTENINVKFPRHALQEIF